MTRMHRFPVGAGHSPSLGAKELLCELQQENHDAAGRVRGYGMVRVGTDELAGGRPEPLWYVF